MSSGCTQLLEPSRLPPQDSYYQEAGAWSLQGMQTGPLMGHGILTGIVTARPHGVIALTQYIFVV